MKKLAKILTLTLAFVLCLGMFACSSYGKVEKALVNIGYAKVETDDAGTSDKMQDESDVAVKVHLFSNKDSLKATEIYKLSMVIVFEFNATEDMKKFYTESETMQGLVKDVQDEGSAEEFYNALVEKGLANGNCLVLSVNPVVYEEVANAVKNA